MLILIDEGFGEEEWRKERADCGNEELEFRPRSCATLLVFDWFGYEQRDYPCQLRDGWRKCIVPKTAETLKYTWVCEE